MKRIVILLIGENEKGNVDYLLAIRDEFIKNDIELYFIPETPDTPISAKLTEGLKNDAPTLREAVSFAKKNKIDEIIIMTDEFMGPVFPLNEFIQKADAFKATCWRLTRDSNMFGLKVKLWNKLIDCQGIADVFRICSENEQEIKELYDTSDIFNYSIKPMTTEPLRVICEKKCPFFVHEIFHTNYEEVLRYSLGHQAPLFYQWLMKCKYWDVNLLWDYMLSSCHQDDYYWNLHLRYVLPTSGSDKKWIKKHLTDHKVALVMHLYYQDKFPESISFARRFPEETHIVVTTNTEEKKEQLIEMLSQQGFSSFEVRLIKNRGRDVSALLVGIADIYDQFDYICFFHDKKTLQTKPGTIGEGFAYKIIENLFATEDFVNHVIKLFDENPRLGMLSPPAPHHAAYFFTLATNWGIDYEITDNLLKELEYKAPISEKHMPIAPLGTCFWFRSEAMKPLFDYGWNYLDFPPEPNKTDGTILHAVERLYPYASIEAGYYPAYVMSDRYAKIEYTNMRYYVEGYNKACVNHGILNKHKEMKNKIISILQNR